MPSSLRKVATVRLTEGVFDVQNLKTEGEKMSLPYSKKLIPRAKELRKNMTPQERHLWYDFLSAYPVRFQRQKAISSYIADFYCSKAKLVVEIDGSQHYTPEGKEHDDNRTYVMEQFGVKVIRFSNYEIDTNFYGVCTVIDRTVRERMSPSVTP